MTKEEELKIVNKQLEEAITIIANTAGEYTQNIVYDALVESGYYINEDEEGEDE